MQKKKFLIYLLLLIGNVLYAQSTESVLQFLKLPVSAHAVALGGENISVVEDDLTMSFHNPALLSCVADNTLNLNYMLYFKGVGTASAGFSKIANDKASWAVTANFMNYGKMKEMTPDNISLGDFSAKDISISGAFCYDLSDYWSGGIRANLIYSKYATKTSFAMGVDLGLNYYLQEKEFSLAFVARNLGGQLKPFEDTRERLPIDLQAGFTKRLAHAPIRISATFYDLISWKNTNFLDHCTLGVDVLLSSNLYLAAGYNFRRAHQLKVNGSSHWAGLTAGAGIQVKRVKVGFAYAKYHVSASSMLFNLSMSI